MYRKVSLFDHIILAGFHGIPRSDSIAKSRPSTHDDALRKVCLVFHCRVIFT